LYRYAAGVKGQCTYKYGKAAEWHGLPSSSGVTADFFTHRREKIRHEGE